MYICIHVYVQVSICGAHNNEDVSLGREMCVSLRLFEMVRVVMVTHGCLLQSQELPALCGRADCKAGAIANASDGCPL